MSKILMLKKSERNKDVEDKNYDVKSLNRGKVAARCTAGWLGTTAKKFRGRKNTTQNNENIFAQKQSSCRSVFLILENALYGTACILVVVLQI